MENPTGIGPFIIMDYIDHERTMSDALNDPLLGPGQSHVLDNNINEQKLAFLYKQMANILLQLSTLSLPRIGSLVQDRRGNISVSGRPLIQNMNSLVEFASVHPKLLPSQQYLTSSQWYSAMADMHLSQATFQRNDAILDEDDARDKFVVRQLFRHLASNNQLATGLDPENGADYETTFRLFSEDLRPSNVLIDKNLCVVGVIDWEFAYVAPAAFSNDPPWWLLLTSPEHWPGGYIPWMKAYEPRLNTFLSVLEEAEEEMQKVSGFLSDQSLTHSWGVPLSQKMRKRWESQTWMFNYAARNSWVFDFLFRKFLDSRWYGQNERGDHRARLDLLAEHELAAMRKFVEIKMQESRTRALVEWGEQDTDSATTKLAKVMV